jgi:hypothetical protein
MKVFATAIIISIIATTMLIAEFDLMAKANPPPGFPIISIYSPSNQTYNSNLLFLNISVYSFAGDFGNKWIGYNLDNGANTTISTTKDGTDTQRGLVYLPFLSNGVHSISVYAVYNFSGRFYNSDWTPYVPSSTRTVSFVIDPNLTSIPTSTNPPITSPSPTVPEFPALTILPLLSSVLVLVFCFKLRKKLIDGVT